MFCRVSFQDIGDGIEKYMLFYMHNFISSTMYKCWSDIICYLKKTIGYIAKPKWQKGRADQEKQFKMIIKGDEA